MAATPSKNTFSTIAPELKLSILDHLPAADIASLAAAITARELTRLTTSRRRCCDLRGQDLLAALLVWDEDFGVFEAYRERPWTVRMVREFARVYASCNTNLPPVAAADTDTDDTNSSPPSMSTRLEAAFRLAGALIVMQIEAESNLLPSNMEAAVCGPEMMPSFIAAGYNADEVTTMSKAVVQGRPLGIKRAGRVPTEVVMRELEGKERKMLGLRALPRHGAVKYVAESGWAVVYEGEGKAVQGPLARAAILEGLRVVSDSWVTGEVVWC